MFRFNRFAMYERACCALTLFPAVSRGGAKAAIPITPGITPIIPPPTPLFAGTPVENIQSPVFS